MKKERKDESFLKTPWFKGGNESMSKVVASNLIYPIEALKEKTEGIVRVKVDIDHLGHVVDAKITASLGNGCDEEAIRVVKLLKFEVAKAPRKLKVIFHKNLNIHFKLPKEKEVSTPVITNKEEETVTNFSYTVVPSVAKKPNASESNRINYTITIN